MFLKNILGVIHFQHFVQINKTAAKSNFSEPYFLEERHLNRSGSENCSAPWVFFGPSTLQSSFRDGSIKLSYVQLVFQQENAGFVIYSPWALILTISSLRESTFSSSCLFFCSTFWRESVRDLILASSWTPTRKWKRYENHYKVSCVWQFFNPRTNSVSHAKTHQLVKLLCDW